MRLFHFIIDTQKVVKAPDGSNTVQKAFTTSTSDIDGQSTVFFSLGDGGDGSTDASRASGNRSLAGYNVHISNTGQDGSNNYTVTGSLSATPEVVIVDGGTAGIQADVTLFAKGRYEG